MTLEFIQSPSVNKERQQFAALQSERGSANSRPTPFQEFEVD
jgi:hypothetical protein